MRDETAPFVLFGVRACDARSFEILDKVFLADPVDTYYQTRREHGTIVTMACSRPEETCFCGAFGIDAADPAGDVTCWIAGDALYWRANTEKGEALTAKLPTAGGLRRRGRRGAAGGHARDPEKAPARGSRPLQGFGGGQDEGAFQPPRMEAALRGVPRLRHLYVRVPDVPVL